MHTLHTNVTIFLSTFVRIGRTIMPSSSPSSRRSLPCLRVIKLSFLLCFTAAFFGQVYRAYKAFDKAEVGTKAALERNGAAQMPNFAVCRHPDQVN